MTESNRIEYKQDLTDLLEKEVIAFLNSPEGGIIYLGIDKKGKVIGLDDADGVQLKVKDRLKNNIHNDFTTELVPKFEIFTDRLELTSAGHIHPGEEQEDFFAGYSIPRNKTLMRVFKDLDMVEYLGSGMPRILKAYSKDACIFSSRFIRTVFPISQNALDLEKQVIAQPGNGLSGSLQRELGAEPGVELGVESRVESPLALKVLHALSVNTLGKQALAEKLGKERPWRYLNELIARLVREGEIEMTIPDKPTSSRQKYRLTEKAKKKAKNE